MSEIHFRHMYELEIKIGANTVDDLAHVFDQIGLDLHMKEDQQGPINICSASPSAVYTITGSIDPEWTAERHKKAMMDWFENRKAGKS